MGRTLDDYTARFTDCPARKPAFGLRRLDPDSDPPDGDDTHDQDDRVGDVDGQRDGLHPDDDDGRVDARTIVGTDLTVARHCYKQLLDHNYHVQSPVHPPDDDDVQAPDEEAFQEVRRGLKRLTPLQLRRLRMVEPVFAATGDLLQMDVHCPVHHVIDPVPPPPDRPGPRRAFNPDLETPDEYKQAIANAVAASAYYKEDWRGIRTWYAFDGRPLNSRGLPTYTPYERKRRMDRLTAHNRLNRPIRGYNGEMIYHGFDILRDRWGRCYADYPTSKKDFKWLFDETTHLFPNPLLNSAEDDA